VDAIRRVAPDSVLGWRFFMVVAASNEAITRALQFGRCPRGRVINSHLTPTAGFTLGPDFDFYTEDQVVHSIRRGGAGLAK